ncbi:unnamed protein product [Absidia cylindrospora]
MPPPRLSLKTETFTPPRLTKRQTILASCDSLNTDQTIQEDKIMLSKLGRWVPLVYEIENQQHGLLTSPSSASLLLQNQLATGFWRSPINDVSEKAADTPDASDYLVHHIKNTSKAARALENTKHEEMTTQICNILNQDWLQYPQLRYCTSQLLAGAILVEKGMTIILNTVEPYARDTQLDAHHEKRFIGSVSSFPSAPGRYGYLSIRLLPSSDGQKLVLGTRTCNFLVTASLRLDTMSVNLGPTTSHFTPSENTKVFLDTHSIALAKSMLSDPSTSRSQTMPSLYLLKQVRSKFDHLSTYALCRSSSTIASRLELQPVTIWTHSDQDTNQAAMSQKRVGSLLFRELATQVISNGRNAMLDRNTIDDIITIAKGNSTVEAVLINIKNLFESQQQSITIIRNTALNNHLVDLANSISNKYENDKKMDHIMKTLYN